MRKSQLLFLIIFVEGYVVLATELLAIRGLVPFVGSGIEVVSIIIGAVLLPLAIGYRAEGMRASNALKEARAQGRYSISIRLILERNLLISLAILAVGLSYIFNNIFFYVLGHTHRIVQTAIYALVFLVTPTYLLAQTVPLVSNYFSRTKLSEITGRMLFFSTAGSFCGSIISTLVLMTFIGVNNTVIVTLTLIAFLSILVSPRNRLFTKLVAAFIAVGAWVANSNHAMEELHVLATTPYSHIALKDSAKDDEKILVINHSASSKFSADPEKRFGYIQYIEKHFIPPAQGEKRNILVLGAGGFVVGWDDKYNKYTFVDIDAALKDVSEQKYLPGPLPENKRFVATSARAFLRETQDKYDLVIVDLFSNIVSIPAEAITREFLNDAKNVMKENAVLIANVISSPTYSDRFSVRYYNTFASVFPVFDRVSIGDFSAWKTQPAANTLYVYYHTQRVDDRTVYTDDKNSYSLDH